MLDAATVESQLGINGGMLSTKNSEGSYLNNPTIGATLQYNNYVVMPRFDLEYVELKDEKANSFLKGSINALYEFENNSMVDPYLLAGVGYEDVQGGTKDILESHPFIQAGGGLSIALPHHYKINIEGKFLEILGGNGEGNEAIVTAGVSIPLGFNPIYKRVSKLHTPIVPISTPHIVYVNSNECSIKTDLPDLDRDGVENRIDQCPSTPCNFIVDNYGCPIRTTLKINFKSNSAEIRAESLPKVERFANFLLKSKGSHVKILGHTDSFGSVKANLALSNRRAYAVMRALMLRGISASRLYAEGRGESMPIASNATAEGRALNRRIEAEISYPQGRR
jgi:OOP family OmpA-OmpF porin